MDDQDYSDEHKIAEYIRMGVITVEGIDENGEIVYALHEEMAKEFAPELWAAHTSWLDEGMLGLYEQGLVEVEYDEDLNAMFRFSEKGYEIASDMGLIPIEMDDDYPEL
jgi:hypothetical protein